MKDEIGGAVIEEFVDKNEHKKPKIVNKNVVARICQNEYKQVLLKNKCFRHSVNRIRSKHHRIGTYEINNISLSSLITKYIFKRIDMADWLLDIRVDCQKELS